MSESSTPKNSRQFFIVAISILVVVFLLLGIGVFSKKNSLSLPFVNSAQPIIKTGEEIFAKAQPSTVRIGVQLSGTVSTPELVYDEVADDYYAGNKTLEEPITTVLVGSGFIVNSKGYIVTNAHVVNVTDEMVRDFVWKKYSDQLYTKINQALSKNADQATRDKYYQKVLNFVSRNGSINNLTYQIAVFNPEQKEGTYEDFVKKGFKAQLKKIGQPYPQLGKDIAILKIDKEGFPSLTLGSAKTLKPGGRIYVLGYPVVADINDSGITEPTFTSGIVSAFKKSSQGDYDVIQIDANSSGGNSGGPAFNERGEIVGIATFGSTVKEGYNWILPVEFAKEFLDELNVKYLSSETK